MKEQKDTEQLIESNFLNYASYVVLDRAIPHIDDGLKPVQRRILHSLFEMHDGHFHKVANVVGHSMKYHPHGDQSIYAALVHLANKDFFIEKQGNFGSLITGDQASAARYIECRLLPLAHRIYYKPELTSYQPSYDGRNKEPLVFPAKFPVVLLHGAEGIAVGMSTRILPHNFGELLDALQASIRGESFALYPDFPSGGLVDVSEYDDGNGKVLVRALIDSSDPKRLLIKELPFSVTTESLIASIEQAARRGKIKIGSISDFSTDRVEIEIKLYRGVYSEDLVESLYAYTDCEVSLSLNLLVIQDKHPRVLSVSELIAYHANRLKELLREELLLEKGHIEQKIRYKTLERIFIEENVYKLLEKLDKENSFFETLLRGLGPHLGPLSPPDEEEMQKLLRIPIRRISAYDIAQEQKQLQELRQRQKAIEKNLKNIKDYALNFLETLLEENKHLSGRKTTLSQFRRTSQRDVAQRDLTLYYNSKTGYLGPDIEGENLGKFSSFDYILLVDQEGVYTVSRVPTQKSFVGTQNLYCGLIDDDIAATRVFSLVYLKDRLSYLKRFRIEKFVAQKRYTDLIPEGAQIVAFSAEPEGFVVGYSSKALIEKELRISLNEFLVKGRSALGRRLSKHPLERLKLIVS